MEYTDRDRQDGRNILSNYEVRNWETSPTGDQMGSKCCTKQLTHNSNGELVATNNRMVCHLSQICTPDWYLHLQDLL